MITKNPNQVLLTEQEAFYLKMFLKEVSCPDSKVACERCPFFRPVTNSCVIGVLRGIMGNRHIVERNKNDKVKKDI